MLSVPRLRTALLVLVLSFGLAALSVFFRGAMDSGVGSLNDEPAHYATSIMVHDFLLGGDWLRPMDYARNWYLHYPKVALGQWPPMLYGMLGIWMVLFGVSGVAAILGMAFLTACCTTALVSWLSEEFGGLEAAVGGLLFLALPVVQQFSGSVMTEIPLALFCTLAVLAFGRFLDRGQTRDALVFGLLAVAGIMTKGNALALGFVPLLGVLYSRRIDLVRRWNFWLPAVMVLLLCAPWYVVTADIQARSWSGGTLPNWDYFQRALPAYLLASVQLGGWGLALLAALGLATGIRKGPGKNGVWIAALAFFSGLLALLVILPSDVDPRHLVLAAPLLIGCAVGGAVCLGRAGGLPRGLGLGLLLGLFALEQFRVVPKDFGGYRGPMADLLGDPANQDAVFLVAGDAIGEGLIIAEGAASDAPRPRHHILRASKVLITDDWNGRDYQLHFPTSKQLQDQLEAFPVAFLILDSSTNPAQRFEHHILLDQLVQERSDAWELISSSPVRRDGELFPDALRIYRLKGWRSLPPAQIQLNTPSGGRFLQEKSTPKPLIWPRSG